MNIENQKTCSDWANETFGVPSSYLSIATRAFEELAELVRGLSKREEPFSLVTECADVVIILYRLGTRTGIDLKTFHIGTSNNAFDAAMFAVRLAVVLIEHLHDRGDRYDIDMVRHCLVHIIGHMTDCAALLGLSIDDMVDAKMIVNRRRKWNLSGDGHGYHVKEEPQPGVCQRAPLGRPRLCVYPRGPINRVGPRRCVNCGKPEPVHTIPVHAVGDEN